MPLGKNRRYNTANGLPLSGGVSLRPNPPPERGAIVMFGTGSGIPAFIETRPKTGAGLPTGDDAEDYIAHFYGVFDNIPVLADNTGAGNPITVGEELVGIITAVAGSWSNNLIGHLVNDPTIANLTIITFGQGHRPRVLDVHGADSITAGNRGEARVLIGV